MGSMCRYDGSKIVQMGTIWISDGAKFVDLMGSKCGFNEENVQKRTTEPKYVLPHAGVLTTYKGVKR
jgi:hypothetical protein